VLTVAVAPGVFALAVKATVPGPLTKVQVPVPTAGVLPASVAAKVPHRFCAGPALAALSKVIVTFWFVVQKAPLLIVQVNT
jgi:hypothetical protein